MRIARHSKCIVESRPVSRFLQYINLRSNDLADHYVIIERDDRDVSRGCSDSYVKPLLLTI